MNYFTVPQLAERMSVGKNTVYDWIERKNDPLPSCNHGERGTRIAEDQFDEWYIRAYGTNKKCEKIDRLVEIK